MRHLRGVVYKRGWKSWNNENTIVSYGELGQERKGTDVDGDGNVAISRTMDMLQVCEREAWSAGRTGATL